MHTADDVVGTSLNSPALLEASARLAAAAIATLAGPLEPPTQFVRGDGNGDGEVDLTDGIFLLEYLFTAGTAPACPDSADANDDGQVNISDIVRMIFHLFAGQGLPEPAGSCGLDLTGDELNCGEYVYCPPQ